MTCVEGSKSGLFVLKTHPKGWELTMLWSPQGMEGQELCSIPQAVSSEGVGWYRFLVLSTVSWCLMALTLPG